VVKKAPDEGIVTNITAEIPWYRPRKRDGLKVELVSRERERREEGDGVGRGKFVVEEEDGEGVL
jgi:hypothetical protein